VWRINLASIYSAIQREIFFVLDNNPSLDVFNTGHGANSRQERATRVLSKVLYKNRDWRRFLTLKIGKSGKAAVGENIAQYSRLDGAYLEAKHEYLTLSCAAGQG